MPVVVPDAGTVPETVPAAKPLTRRRWVPYLLLAPGLLWLAVFFAIPLVTLFTTSLQSPNPDGPGYIPAFDVGNYVTAVQEYLPQFLRSFGYAAMATIAALLLAYPLAYFIAFKAGRWRNLMLILIVAPFFCSFLVRTNAWKSILADESWISGIINLFIPGGQIQILSTWIAVVAGITYNFLPFMILPLYASLERIDPRLIEAAGDLYSRPFTGFRKVTLPLSMPGVVAGTLLTFIPAAGDYISAELLGSPRTTMIGNVIQAQFVEVRNYPLASSLSFILMALILVMVFAYVRRAGTEDLV
jgi:spermidine/putrescine transport system permease protein